jgi:hypothetical protein
MFSALVYFSRQKTITVPVLGFQYLLTIRQSHNTLQ